MEGPSRSSGIGFYRDADGQIRTGGNTPDPMWMARKGWTFIGCAEYGPDGSLYEPLMALGLTEEAQKVLENRKEAIADAARQAELKATQAQREKAELGAAIAAATVRALREEGALDTDADEPKARGRKKTD